MFRFRGRTLARERLAFALRLLVILGLVVLTAWAFSGPSHQTMSDEQPPKLQKAEPPPTDQGSAWPETPASLLSPEPLNPPQSAERPPSAVVKVEPPYDVVDVRTIRAGGRTITLAGIEGFDQNATCRARDGTRWSCAKLAKDGLRSRVGNQSLNCKSEGDAGGTALVATCMTSAGEDLARALVADGWARARDDTPQLYGTEAKAAEEQGLGLWGLRMEGRMKRR